MTGQLEVRSRKRPLALLSAAYLITLAVPSQVALIGPLRSNGSFVRLIGLVCAVVAVIAILTARQRRPLRPIAVLTLTYLGLQFAIWGLAFRWPQQFVLSGTRDRALLITLSAAGIVSLCALAVRELYQAEKLASLLVTGAALSAVVGLLQVANVIGPLEDYLRTAVTTTVVDKGGITSRGDLTRVAGAAGHPIEFAVCLAMVLPLGIHLLRHSATRRGRIGAGMACALILFAFPFGVSRAGLLTLTIALSVYGLFLPLRQRLLLLGAILLILAVTYVTAPRIVGTFAASITGAAQDNSITGRLDDYPAALERVSRAPWLGGAPPQGAFTFDAWNTVLDNQWLVTLVASGILGVAALALLLLGGAGMAMREARAHPAGSAARSLNAAVAAGVLGAAVAAFTFDLLAFQQVTFLVFLLLALVGVRESDMTRLRRGAGRSARHAA
jgi:hypothetical protein